MSQAPEGCCQLPAISAEAAQDYVAKIEAAVAEMPGRIVYFQSWDGYPNAYYDPGFCLRPENQEYVRATNWQGSSAN